MNTTSKNLGMVSAIHLGTSEPSNTLMLWIDTSFTPPKKKAYNNATSSWMEVVFLPSPANILKKLIYKQTGSIDEPIYLQDEDVFIKNANLNVPSYVNIPAPNANLDGKTYKFINLNQNIENKIILNHPISNIQDENITELEGMSTEIMCLKDYGSENYIWRIIG